RRTAACGRPGSTRTFAGSRGRTGTGRNRPDRWPGRSARPAATGVVRDWTWISPPGRGGCLPRSFIPTIAHSPARERRIPMPELWIALPAGPLPQPCADAAARLLTDRGRSVRLYHADGAGGRALEADVLAGRVAAVLDLTLTELAAELTGAPGGAGPDRLTAAALRGVPQVIARGGPAAGPGGAGGGGGPPGPPPYRGNRRRGLRAHDAGGERPARPGDRPQGERRPRADGGAGAAARPVGAGHRGRAVLVAGGRRGAGAESTELDQP